MASDCVFEEFPGFNNLVTGGWEGSVGFVLKLHLQKLYSKGKKLGSIYFFPTIL